jgi:hypothetical protein
MTTGILKKMTVIGAALVCAASCVYVDDNLGQNFIPGDQIYEVRTATFDLDGIRMGYSDSLSAYSSSRITVGAIRDSKFGLTSRSSAFTIVPVVDTIDVGENPRVTQFHFTVSRDTTSVEDEGQTNILQNIYVHRLEHVLDSTYLYTVDLNDKDFIGKETITRGIPVYNGGDSLSFDFSDDFAMEMVKLFQEDPDIQMDLDEYLEKMPGIYIRSDAPATEGGRINMFNCPIEVSDSYYVTGNYAELKIRSDYGTRKDVDTSFLFYFGPQERTTDTEQYAFNICDSHPEDRTFLIEDTENKTRSILYTATDGKIYVEGGNGLKPVISAVEIKNLLTDHLKEEGLDPDEIIVNKASVILPFDEFINSGEYDYSQNYMLPDILSPTCRFSYYSESLDNADGERIRYVSYAGLTDASVESENQGDVNLSLSRYSPDISHHVQEVLRASDDSLATGRYDIWLLVMVNEVVTSTNEQQQEMSEYYQNLAYASYYNSLYGGYGYGYGYGYSGYGYNSYYNNYYNYMLAAQYASASAVQEETVAQLDKDRFYRLVINGPASESRPQLTVVYSYIQRDAVNQQNEEQ